VSIDIRKDIDIIEEGLIHQINLVAEHMEDSQGKTSKFFLMDIMVMILR
jgi:hypothetical protein